VKIVIINVLMPSWLANVPVEIQSTWDSPWLLYSNSLATPWLLPRYSLDTPMQTYGRYAIGPDLCRTCTGVVPELCRTSPSQKALWKLENKL